MSTKLSIDNFEMVASIAALAAISEADCFDKRIVLVEESAIYGGTGVAMYYYDASFVLAERSPFTIYPSDTGGTGAWTRSAAGHRGAANVWAAPNFFYSGQGQGFYTTGWATAPAISFRAAEGDDTNFGISANNPVTAVQLIADDVPRVSVAVAATTVANPLSMEGDGTYDAHDQTGLPVGTRHPILREVAGATYTVDDTREESVVSFNGGIAVAVTVDTVTAGSHQWTQLLNSNTATGDVTLSQGAGLNQFVLFEPGIGANSYATVVMDIGGVASVYYKSNDTVFIYGSGLTGV